MKNLVMGASKLDWFTVEPFVVSCRQNCPDADLVLFVDDVSDFTFRQLERGGVLVQPIPDDLKNKHVANARWIMFKRFLDSHEEYDKVLVTDVRDVFFQGDIFKSYDGGENFLVYGTHPYIIKDEPTNTRWIRNIFSEEDYQKIKDNHVACCGVIYGSRVAMDILLTGMTKIIERTNVYVNMTQFDLNYRAHPNFGNDQAALNYLIYNKLLPVENIFESSPRSGKILNIDQTAAKVLGDKIVNESGEIPACVHQWPEFASMVQLVDRLYREKDFQPDESFSDARSSLDQTLCLTFRQNWNGATKFFVSHALYFDLNNFGNVLLKIWQMILQTPTPNFDTETLSVAVQSKIPAAFSANLNINQMENIYAAYAFCENTRRAINPALRNFVANMTLRFVEIFQQNGRMDLSLKYLERAARMNMLAALNAT